MSKRQEDFREMSKDLHVQFLSNPWTIYETGCEDGYQYAVDKACEWLTNYFVNYLQFDKQIISDFRKAMEDGGLIMKQVKAGDEIYVENIQHDYGWRRVQFIADDNCPVVKVDGNYVRVAYSAIKEVR